MQDKLFIDGKWVDAQSGEKFDVVDPSNREVFHRIARGGAADIDAAVTAARKSLRLWSLAADGRRRTRRNPTPDGR